MTGPTRLPDADARQVVTASLSRNLFVEAGAGSGKTTALVNRVVNLVAAGTPIGRIAAITFTEAAARELRTRVRDELETRAEHERDERLLIAAGEVASAPFTTVHGFALRLLLDHPVEAGLPPGFEVADEVTSMLEFDEAWRLFVGQVGDDLDLLDVQERAAALGVELRRFVDIARRFDDNWDLLGGLDVEPRSLEPLVLGDLVAAVAGLGELVDHCLDPADRLAAGLVELGDAAAPWVEASPLAQLAWLQSIRWPARNHGRKGNWIRLEIDEARRRIEEVRTGTEAAVAGHRAEVISYLVVLVAGFVSRRVAARRSAGRLAFHDLLVLARRLLRTDPGVREAVHQRYRYVLLDEFQDTDPIQIELAVLVAAAGDVGERPWQELAPTLAGGRLVVVGDPKQSIYRFRRADIALYADAEAAIAPEPQRLVTNFRSVPGIVEWVNATFAELIGDGDPGRQPRYVPLAPVRDADPDRPVPVMVVGGPHPRSVSVGAIREREAADVAGVVCRAMAEEWRVERDGRWRPIRLQDIAVLIPSRLSLPALEASFSAANIPFRPETSSLVYATQEVRDVLAALRAVVDPSSAIDVVAALRSGLFAVGDDDLLAWHLAGRSWDYTAPAPAPPPSPEPVAPAPVDPTSVADDPVPGSGVAAPTDPAATIDLRDRPAATTAGPTASGPPAEGPSVDDGPVAEALAVLTTWHRDRWWVEPAALIERVVRERRLREAALAEPRPRDRWRRYRFLAEQARQFSATQGGDLRDFVAWAELQSSDLARVTEPIPAEPDDDAVRVLTVHGSKGLEFPMVILAGAPTREMNRAPGPQVLFPSGEAPEVALGKGKATERFDVHASVEEVLDHYERVRLQYVAATRARDLLIVSAHHKEGLQSGGARIWGALDADDPRWRPIEVEEGGRYRVEVPTQLRLAGGDHRDAESAWHQEQDRIIAGAVAARTMSATGLARAAGLDGGPLPAEEPAGRADDGRAEEPVGQPVGENREHRRLAVAFGLAVHGVLELADFDDRSTIADLASVKAAEHGVADRAGDVARYVDATLDAPVLQLARSHRHWRELYVSAPVGDGSLEGFIDLCIDGPDGLVIVDYKTHLLEPGDLDERVARYRQQGAVYALALSEITDRPVAECRFVFVGPDGAEERSIVDLDDAVDEVRRALSRSA